MNEYTTINVQLMEKQRWREIIDLSVGESQVDFIETSSHCLTDAETSAYHIQWNFYGIYLDNTLIGFAMHGRQTFGIFPYSQVWLDRFMIDKAYQGLGFGKKSLKLILQMLEQDYNTNTIYLSVHEQNKSSIALYEKMGFVKTFLKYGAFERVMKRKSIKCK